MEQKTQWCELINRANNFHNKIISIEEKNQEQVAFFKSLYNFKESIVVKLNEMKESTAAQKLDAFFSEMFNFIIEQDPANEIFCKDLILDNKISLYSCVFDACSYTALCIFLHNTKRSKGMTLRQFVYNNSTANYSQEKDFTMTKNENLSSEESMIKKMRNRILSERIIYDERDKWQAVSKDSEYEWSMLFHLRSLSVKLNDTYKRMGNLYNDINKALSSPKDQGYTDRVKNAYKKFSSKLAKIKYEDFLSLQKELVDYISKNKDYYGMNIYRYEKEQMLYKITLEVNSLLECKDEEEMKDFLNKTYYLKDIHYSKVYSDFSLFNFSLAANLAYSFFIFRNFFVSSSCLILDELVEKECFTENWEQFFLNTINEKTESVFYNLNEINYTVTPKSQEAFEEILSFSVIAQIHFSGYDFKSE